MRIGIYGGTFNPVHHGHLRTALEVSEQFNLGQLRLIPCRLPAHRQIPEVSAELRFSMLQLAIANSPGLQIDRRELDRVGPSYMVDTLESIALENPKASLILFIGADAFSGLEQWHCWQRLFEFAHIVVMTRPNYAKPKLSAFLSCRLCHDQQQLFRTSNGQLYFQTVTALDISATTIRSLIASHRNPQFLLPDSVIEFIRDHQLYLLPTRDIECKQKNY